MLPCTAVGSGVHFLEAARRSIARVEAREYRRALLRIETSCSKCGGIINLISYLHYFVAAMCIVWWLVMASDVIVDPNSGHPRALTGGSGLLNVLC